MEDKPSFSEVRKKILGEAIDVEGDIPPDYPDLKLLHEHFIDMMQNPPKEEEKKKVELSPEVENRKSVKRSNREVYIENLKYGLLKNEKFKELRKMWFDYSMPYDIEKYYECMKMDSKKKTKDCERCNNDMCKKLEELYKLGLEKEEEKDIPAQGYTKRDFTSCHYPLGTECDCLVACEKCDILFCMERDYEGNTAPGVIISATMQWQGLIDRAKSEGLPDLLNPDGTVHDEHTEFPYALRHVETYMKREMLRNRYAFRDLNYGMPDEQYETELERIVKQNVLNYYKNRAQKCRYNHLTCKYNWDRHQQRVNQIPRYVPKRNNPNCKEELWGKWEPM
ncbi:uncharacterized protein LOC109856461 [Pseudomyrmex gracilis]|uniref:uncharacterized protein LOC109856461 n=1 Tax=Pseudomyrmex gracilis TaxID=219809 RepID=UPI000995295A|nr:uncharacterized protein LOC109856461 [Pseudomyrmex gracilis]